MLSLFSLLPPVIWEVREGQRRAGGRLWLAGDLPHRQQATGHPSALSLDPLKMLSASWTPFLCADLKGKKNKLTSHYGRHSLQVWTSETRLWQENASCPLSPAFIPGPLNSHCYWWWLVRKWEKRRGALNAMDRPIGLFIQWKKLDTREWIGDGSLTSWLLSCWTI